MKKLYPLALLLGSLILTSGVNAQSFTYTAVRNGNWHTTSGPNVWDPSGEPPASCSSCKIIINAGVTVTLNTHITLSGGSILQIGSDGSAAAALLIPSSGSTTNWTSSYNIILPNDGSNPTNAVKVVDGLSLLNASNAGTYDGVLTSYISGGTTTYFKKVGNAPDGFIETTVVSESDAAWGKTLTGPETLSATGTLPIILVDFNAVVNNGAVDLSWKTLLETNSSRFDIERSTDGSRWDVIGTVAAKGNSSTATNYSFTDGNPGSGTLEYRIHGYDLDGRPTLSPVKVVRTTAIASVSVYPNPATNYVNVTIPATETSAVNIRLIGLSGQLLAEKNVSGAGGTVQTFTVSNYPPGNYLIQVLHSDGTKQVSKVLISRN